MSKETNKIHYQNEILKSVKPSIIEVFAEWCGKCQQMKPILKELEKEYGNTYDFFVIDVDKEQDFIKELGVTSVPTFIFIKNGEIKGTEHGFMPKEDLLEKIKKMLAK